MDVRLYTIPGSHPGVAVARMLDRKGISYRRTDLIPVASKPILKLLGFPGTTVPAARIDGRRIQGSMRISHALEELAPEPALYPADQAHRATVERIERFADTDLQHPVRQLIWWALKRRRQAMASYAEGASLGVPVGLAVRTGGPLVEMAARYNGSTDRNVQAALAGLPGSLNRIDDWIADGALGGPEPTAADLQVAASLRLAMTMDDLREPIAARPAGRFALQLIPDYPGRMPPVLPAPWLEPLRGSSSARPA